MQLQMSLKEFWPDPGSNAIHFRSGNGQVTSGFGEPRRLRNCGIAVPHRFSWVHAAEGSQRLRSSCERINRLKASNARTYWSLCGGRASVFFPLLVLAAERDALQFSIKGRPR
jgi:hypothetical protein